MTIRPGTIDLIFVKSVKSMKYIMKDRHLDVMRVVVLDLNLCYEGASALWENQNGDKKL